MKLSIICNGYKEPLMARTIKSLLDGCVLDTEILCIINGNWNPGDLPSDSRLRVAQIENKGPRNAINTGIRMARGTYFMRIDAHCLVDYGFDKKLLETFEEDWIVIPRRYILDEIGWKRDLSRPIRDYHYFSFPKLGSYGLCSATCDWKSKGEELQHIPIDDTMTYQGSCWMVHKAYFLNKVGYLNDSNDAYGPAASDNFEVGVKYWLSGASVKVNKKTWYAHLSKRKVHIKNSLYDFKEKRSWKFKRGFEWATKHWINNEEPGMIHPFSWLIEKFWPVPGWPEDRSLWRFSQ